MIIMTLYPFRLWQTLPVPAPQPFGVRFTPLTVPVGSRSLHGTFSGGGTESRRLLAPLLLHHDPLLAPKAPCVYPRYKLYRGGQRSDIQSDPGNRSAAPNSAVSLRLFFGGGGGFMIYFVSCSFKHPCAPGDLRLDFFRSINFGLWAPLDFRRGSSLYLDLPPLPLDLNSLSELSSSESESDIHLAIE